MWTKGDWLAFFAQIAKGDTEGDTIGKYVEIATRAKLTKVKMVRITLLFGSA